MSNGSTRCSTTAASSKTPPSKPRTSSPNHGSITALYRLSYHVSSPSEFTYRAADSNQDHLGCCHSRTYPDPWVIFLENCHALENFKIKIIIIDPRAVVTKDIFPVSITDSIYQRWPLLRRRIREELRTEKWEALQVLKRGYLI